MALRTFLLIIFLLNVGFSKQTSLLDQENYSHANNEQITTESVTTKRNQRISERACDVYKYQFHTVVKVIFGGKNAKPGSMPHMGAIGWRSKFDSPQWVFKCGGSLISARFLVTAAHCSWISLRTHFDVVSNEPEIVRLGVENIIDVDESIEREELVKVPTDKKIKKIIKQPNYKAPKKYFDIALIELEDDVMFTIYLHPACLWTQPELFNNNAELTLSGWGLTEDGKPSSYLQVASVESLSTELCDKLLMKYRDRNWHGFADHQMCAGKLAGKVDTCQGDSGGPIQQKIPFKSLHYIIGVTSFGVRCGKENQPGVYTKIYSVLDWIEENVWNIK